MTASLSVVVGGDGSGDAVATTVTQDKPWVIGRSSRADIVIDDPRVSRQHILIEPEASTWRVRDISSYGSWHNGIRIDGDGLRVPRLGELRINLGSPVGPQVVLTDRSAPTAPQPAAVPLLASSGHHQPPAELPRRPPSDSGGRGTPPRGELTHVELAPRIAHRLYLGRISIGRGQESNVCLPDLLVSRHHAELRIGRTEAEILDLNSANGTFVNGQRVTRSPLFEGDVIAIGHYLLQVKGATLVEFVDSGDVSFEAQGLSVFAGKKQLMHDVSFRLPARTLIAVVGPSGAGKSTLLNALTGFRPADSGFVRYAGRDLYTSYEELRRRIGYVPQEDLLHTSLTVRKALEYGAELRFPPDVTADERRLRVDEVLRELGLSNHSNTKVSQLSGGQRKRTSVALELLTKPSLLYLDEPTSGLDPGLDKSVMHSLRALADDGRTVVVVTHSVANLDVCDLVLMLAPGGYVAYLGAPQGALAYFKKADFADVFLALEATPGAEWGSRFRASNLYVTSAVGAPSARRMADDLASIRQQPVRHQLATLVRRYLNVVVSDRSYLRLIIAFPLLLGIIPRVIPAKNGLSIIAEQPNRDAPTVLMVLILCACFMGMANSVREIVKERPIYRRERAIGLSLTAYLGSKIIVLSLLTAPQAVIFTLIGVLGRTPSEGVVLGSPLLEVVIAVVMTALVSVMLGLLVSTLVDSADKTMPLLVLITMAQLVLSGGLIPLEGKAGLEQVSWMVPARWGYAAVGSSIDLNDVLKTSQPAFKTGPPDPLWNHAASTYLADIGFGLGVAVLAVILCSYLLRRADPKPRRDTPHPGAPAASVGFPGPAQAATEGPGGPAWHSSVLPGPRLLTGPTTFAGLTDRAPRQKRTRLWVAAGVSVALAAGLFVGGFLFLQRDEERKLTSGGKTVVNPGMALGTAEAIVAGLVTRRHGVKAADTRCYFSAPNDSTKTADSAEIGESIYCGPVLFVDGKSPAEYLQFASLQQVSGNGVRLSVADAPVSSEPGVIPNRRQLIRPDGATPSVSRLATPRPPPATGGELLVTSDHAAMRSVNVGMGANLAGVRLAQLGTMDRFGRGDNARVAPVAGKLIAFTLDDWVDCDSQCGRWRTSAVKLGVGDQPMRALPSIVDGQHFVLAVAEGTQSVDLVMIRDGYTQRISLLTGTAAATNITLLGDDAFPSATIKKTFAWKEHDSVRLTYGPNVTADPNLNITVSSADLSFFVFGHTPSSPNNAFLTVYATYTYQGISTKYGFWADQTRLETAGGAQYRSVAIRYKTYDYEVYEVPANIRSAVFVIGGSHASKSSNGTPYTATIPIAKVPIKFA